MNGLEILHFLFEFKQNECDKYTNPKLLRIFTKWSGYDGYVELSTAFCSFYIIFNHELGSLRQCTSDCCNAAVHERRCFYSAESGLKRFDMSNWTTFLCSEWEKQHVTCPRSLKLFKKIILHSHSSRKSGVDALRKLAFEAAGKFFTKHKASLSKTQKTKVMTSIGMPWVI